MVNIVASFPITHVMNLSIINGVVPNELKVAKVVPIYKSGDRRLINNYRPVSVLPCFSKILEKLMYNRISNFIHKHSLLRGRSQLSTFMKAYTAYARGEGVWDHRTLFPENQHLFLITDNVLYNTAHV